MLVFSLVAFLVLYEGFLDLCILYLAFGLVVVKLVPSTVVTVGVGHHLLPWIVMTLA